MSDATPDEGDDGRLHLDRDRPGRRDRRPSAGTSTTTAQFDDAQGPSTTADASTSGGRAARRPAGARRRRRHSASPTRVLHVRSQTAPVASLLTRSPATPGDRPAGDAARRTRPTRRAPADIASTGLGPRRRRRVRRRHRRRRRRRRFADQRRTYRVSLRVTRSRRSRVDRARLERLASGRRRGRRPADQRRLRRRARDSRARSPSCAGSNADATAQPGEPRTTAIAATRIGLVPLRRPADRAA